MNTETGDAQHGCSPLANCWPRKQRTPSSCPSATVPQGLAHPWREWGLTGLSPPSNLGTSCVFKS